MATRNSSSEERVKELIRTAKRIADEGRHWRRCRRSSRRSVTSGRRADPPKVNYSVLRGLDFETPRDAHARYLGLSGSGSFRLPQIKANLLLVEIFSMYCPICQAEAPNVNALYKMIEADPALKGKMRVLGVGIGNTQYEIGVFRGRYGIPFPLVADPDSNVQKCFRELVRTPTFIVLERSGRADFRVKTVHVGRIEKVEDFLRSVAR